MTLDRHGTVTFCNDFLLRTTGWSRGEVIGANWFSQFVPDNSEVKALFLQTIAVGNLPAHYENPIRTKSGELREIVWNNTMLRDSEGRICGTASVGQDVTEKKRAEKRIREQAEMLNRAHEAIIVRDIHTRRISFWNQGAERLYGWTAAEAKGRDMGELIFAEASRLEAVTGQLLKTGEWRGEHDHVSKAGERLIISGSATLVRDAGGEPKSALCINIDITAQKNLEELLLRAQRMESLGTLASGVAHDLNNILAPIMMSVPLLRRDLSPEQREGIISTIEISAKRGAEIVKQVLTFGRGVEGERHPLQMAELIDEMVKILAETFPKNVEIVPAIDSHLWPIIGDATQLHQVLLNLCVNARDAMPDGGELRLRARNFSVVDDGTCLLPEATPGPHVLIEITDTGAGIPREIQHRIFDPFFTTKGAGHGTGLGLSTVLGIVKNHGGCIDVASAPGKGTAFKVYLPAIAEASAEQAFSTEEPARLVEIPRPRL
jgi:PAS domain S-box-containing protein